MQNDLLIIAGRLGGDPEMRYMPDGTAVTNFSVACTRYGGKDANGAAVNYTAWFRIASWGRQAEACNEYLAKGQMVTVYGSLTVDKESGGPRIYQRADGTSGASFEVNADNVVFGSRVASDPRAAGESTEAAAPAKAEEDDIPF